jgi:crossover junction endodeoxyribonuclease RuvC
VEKVFLAKNASSALKLARTRSAAIVTCGAHGVAVHEYSAKETGPQPPGSRGSSQEQVAGMVAPPRHPRPDPPDASDALAMAFLRRHHACA